MKIGIFFDGHTNAGGGFYLSQSKLHLLTKSVDKENQYICFVTTNSSFNYLKKYENYNLKIFKVSLFLKLIFFLFSFQTLKRIFKLFKFKNPLETELKKNQIDLLFFVSPSSFVRFCDETNFVYNIWEMQHRSIPFFPEYTDKKYSTSNFEIRENSYKFAVDKAFKVIIDSDRSKHDIVKAYNCSREDIFETQAFVPTLPNYFEKVKDKNNFDNIFEKLNLPKKKILFYPAQFWPHKNHIYLVNSLERMIQKDNKDFIMVFTGHDKGNKEYILSQIRNKNLQDYIFVFEYLSLEQIISLYLNSFAMTMTSLVGRSSLPLREAFYFGLPVFYSSNILDKKYSCYVNELNLNDFNSLNTYLSKDNFSIDSQKISKAKEFYNITCNDQVIIDNYKHIINEYKFNQDFWKKN